MGRVRARLERVGPRVAHRGAYGSGARIQIGPARDLDPVETVRRPPNWIGAKTQSDLISNGERPTEMLGPPSAPLGHDSSHGVRGEATACRYPVSPSRKQWALGVVGIDPGSAEANALSAPPGEYDRKVKTQRN